MNRFIFPPVFFFATFLAALPPASAVTIAWSPVGNPGNEADIIRNVPGAVKPGTQRFGAVDHQYAIGTYDVTTSQYVEFLNAKVPTGNDVLGLFSSSIALSQYAGIKFSAAAPNGSKYSAILGRENFPVNFVTFPDAARFANWMNNGQGDGSTETGAYTLLGGTAIPSNYATITRSLDAKIFLPTEDEWYKAAYYNQVTSSYYVWPTSSDLPPSGTGPTAAPNSANFNSRDLTPVGAYSGTTSPYGAFDMGGNVSQLTETYYASNGNHVTRGGSFNFPDGMQSSFRTNESFFSGTGYYGTGFRLAMVPEPSTATLAVLPLAFGLMWTLRKRLTNR